MTGFCVIISGRLPGDKDDASVWAPVREGFKLDEATFKQRVLAALPLLVKQNLDAAAADRLTQQLLASGVDACTLPDDAQLAFLERAGTMRGPLPLSALGNFIRLDERYRLRGGQDWQVWTGPEPALDLSLPEPYASVSLDAPEDEIRPPSPRPDEQAPPPFAATATSPLVTPWDNLPGLYETPPPLPSEPPPPPFIHVEEPEASAIVPPFVEHGPGATAPEHRLEPATALLPGTFSTDFQRPRKPPPPRSRAGWWIGGLSFALVAGGLSVLLYIRHQNVSKAQISQPNSNVLVENKSSTPTSRAPSLVKPFAVQTQKSTASPITTNETPAAAIPTASIQTASTSAQVAVDDNTVRTSSAETTQSDAGTSPSNTAVKAVVQAAEKNDWSSVDSQVEVLKQQVSPLQHGDRLLAKRLNTQAISLLNQDNFQAGIEALVGANKADPADIEVSNNLGYAYQKAGLNTQAFEILDRTLSQSPRRVTAWENLARVYAQSGDTAASEACARITLRFSKNPTGTIAFMEKIVTDDPDSPYGKVLATVISSQTTSSTSASPQ